MASALGAFDDGGEALGAAELSAYERASFEVCAVLYALGFLYAALQSAMRLWVERERAAAHAAIEAGWRAGLRRQQLDARAESLRARLEHSSGDATVRELLERELLERELLEQQAEQRRLDARGGGGSGAAGVGDESSDSEADEAALRVLGGRGRSVSSLNRSRIFYVGQNLALAFLLRTAWIVLTLERVAPGVPEGEPACYDKHTLLAGLNRLAQLLLFTAYLSMVGFLANVLRAVERARSQQRSSLISEREIAAALAQSTTRRRPGETVVAVPDLFAQQQHEQQQQQQQQQQQPLPAGESAVGDQQGFNAICSLLCVLLTPDAVQVLLNFWVYVVIAVLLFAQWFECDPVKYKAVDVTQTVVIAIFFAGLALMFARYGLRLLLLLRQMQHPVRARLAANIATICTLCASLFLLRGVLFLLEPLFHYRITGWWQDALFPWAFYPLPELVPGIVMLHLMAPRPRQVRVRQDDQRPLLASAAADAASAPGRAADADAAAGVAGFGSFTAKPQGRDTFWV